MPQIKIFKARNIEGLEIEVNSWIARHIEEIFGIESITFHIDSAENPAFPYYCMVNFQSKDLSC